MAPQKIQPALGRRLTIARAAKGLTQREVATRAHVTPVYLCQLEHGEGTPSLELLAFLADILGTRVSDLLRQGKK